jgi:hypothetical protein
MTDIERAILKEAMKFVSAAAFITAAGLTLLTIFRWEIIFTV